RARARRARSPRARAACGATSRGALPLAGFEDVTGLPHGADQRWAGGVELLAQVADVGLDDVRVAAEVVAPDVLEDLSLRQDTTRVQHEETEEVELGRGELDPALAAEDLVAALVEHEVGELEQVPRQLARGATQDRLHARDDLGEAERLRHV